MTHFRARRLDNGAGLRVDDNFFFGRGNGERDIRGRDLAYAERDVSRRFGEAGSLHRELIAAGRDIRKSIIAFIAGRACLGLVGVLIAKANRGPGHNGAGLIPDRAVQLRERSSLRKARWNHSKQEKS